MNEIILGLFLIIIILVGIFVIAWIKVPFKINRMCEILEKFEKKLE